LNNDVEGKAISNSLAEFLKH